MNDLNKTEYQKVTIATLDESRRTRCEVWTRVMGYHRPVSSFNIGKKGEFKERLFFEEACLPIVDIVV
jgi:hypothetical protein